MYLFTSVSGGGNRALEEPLAIVLGPTSVIFAFIGVALSARNGVLKRAMNHDLVVESLRRLRIASAAVAVLAALSYAGMTVVSLPIRHEVQRQLDRRLEIGEIAHYEEMTKEASP
ncbi:hypothetical protein EON80_21675 [bacterium]|nr:MAG: hypothetical protein EON80_21675 [bacterium]